VTSDMREPQCDHDPYQPASLCRVCEGDGRLAAWIAYWAERRNDAEHSESAKAPS
jgi:hypothetical protein